jgi:hypothetical protein
LKTNQKSLELHVVNSIGANNNWNQQQKWTPHLLPISELLNECFYQIWILTICQVVATICNIYIMFFETEQMTRNWSVWYSVDDDNFGKLHINYITCFEFIWKVLCIFQLLKTLWIEILFEKLEFGKFYNFLNIICDPGSNHQPSKWKILFLLS